MIISMIHFHHTWQLFKPIAAEARLGFYPMPTLNETTAVVTGASRGGGRGIAVTLGEAGATVYVTGRSVNTESTTDDVPGTIDETAEEVTERGGVGIPVRCDHTVDTDVEALFDRVKQDCDQLDLLVNNVWGGYEPIDGKYVAGDPEAFDVPFWEQPLDHWEGMFTAGVRAHLTASRLAAPLMVPHQQGLIINTTYWDQDTYLNNLFYDLSKTAINRMAFGMARELREYDIAAVALSPGYMRTERVLADDEFDDLDQTESPEYIGRAVAALAADPDVMEQTGQILRVADLAREYDFTDIDGTQPPAFTMDMVRY
jgi:NAD(P)-dependent dehydrogenase (short-subunit alcohol dehydrogenase family)